ncbi:MAG TPA: YcaO-like family protein [Gemmatimonadaceae bacterium]|nr:YcaO-like family protein [Gemmatimonadaceae bacterium]
MDIVVAGSGLSLAPATDRLLRRMLCPLSGLSQSVGFVTRSALEPRVAVAGGDMTGVHVLRGQSPPRPGAYHIGGSGVTYDEAVIRTLGETVERYAQFIAGARPRHRVVVASHEELVARGDRALVPEGLRYFSDAQLARPGFPFSPLRPDTVIGWVAADSLIDGAARWAPAQLALVGYVRGPGEPQVMSGVTTGSAAHTKLDQALRSALLELIQIDSAIGHWFGGGAAVPIGSDRRTRPLDDLVARAVHRAGPAPRFYWLPNADLPGLTIACAIEGSEVPRLAVGLGCDLRLCRAMYKAFLEGVAVAQLAKVILFRQAVADAAGGRDGAPPTQFYDLDTNVAHYALRGRDAIRAKFGDEPAVPPSTLPPDCDAGAAGDVRHLVKAFADTGKELTFFDLTTQDIADLGFCVVRTWSPDLVSLPLPSAPPLMHPRFRAYGGVTNEAPHPYP